MVEKSELGDDDPKSEPDACIRLGAVPHWHATRRFGLSVDGIGGSPYPCRRRLLELEAQIQRGRRLNVRPRQHWFRAPKQRLLLGAFRQKYVCAESHSGRHQTASWVGRAPFESSGTTGIGGPKGSAGAGGIASTGAGLPSSANAKSSPSTGGESGSANGLRMLGP